MKVCDGLFKSVIYNTNNLVNAFIVKIIWIGVIANHYKGLFNQIKAKGNALEKL